MPVNPQASSHRRSRRPGRGPRYCVGSHPSAADPGERCDMCAEPIGAEHQHVVNLESRGLMCTCRGCCLLFTADARAALPGGARPVSVVP